MSKTIFCDIDGTLVKHQERLPPLQQTIVLDGTADKLIEWVRKVYKLILVTGRRESARKMTEKELAKNGILYDHLIMGAGVGERIIINDKTPDGKDSCSAINLTRDTGIKTLEI